MTSEKKMIFAEDLFDVLRDDININGANLARVRRHIEAAPAVDAVEVVRCKACEHHIKTKAENVVYCQKYNRFMKADDFCSYGERREGE